MFPLRPRSLVITVSLCKVRNPRRPCLLGSTRLPLHLIPSAVTSQAEGKSTHWKANAALWLPDAWLLQCFDSGSVIFPLYYTDFGSENP